MKWKGKNPQGKYTWTNGKNNGKKRMRIKPIEKEKLYKKIQM